MLFRSLGRPVTLVRYKDELAPGIATEPWKFVSSVEEFVELWQDQKSNDAHEASAPNKAYRARLSPVGGALYDQRWYKAL